jgi:hypothetical protein
MQITWLSESLLVLQNFYRGETALLAIDPNLVLQIRQLYMASFRLSNPNDALKLQGVGARPLETKPMTKEERDTILNAFEAQSYAREQSLLKLREHINAEYTLLGLTRSKAPSFESCTESVSLDRSEPGVDDSDDPASSHTGYSALLAALIAAGFGHVEAAIEILDRVLHLEMAKESQLETDLALDARMNGDSSGCGFVPKKTPTGQASRTRCRVIYKKVLVSRLLAIKSGLMGVAQFEVRTNSIDTLREFDRRASYLLGQVDPTGERRSAILYGVGRCPTEQERSSGNDLSRLAYVHIVIRNNLLFDLSQLPDMSTALVSTEEMRTFSEDLRRFNPVCLSRLFSEPDYEDTRASILDTLAHHEISNARRLMSEERSDKLVRESLCRALNDWASAVEILDTVIGRNVRTDLATAQKNEEASERRKNFTRFKATIESARRLPAGFVKQSYATGCDR